MELKSISRLADLMAKHGLSELELSENGSSIRLCRPVGGAVPLHAIMTEPAEAAVPQEPEQPAGEAVQAAAAAEEEGRFITAPMVGTFFTSATPEGAPYVEVGDVVTPESVVCIIEAMKVMNEIKAETAGAIVKVLVPNGAPVEFGQPLFELR